MYKLNIVEALDSVEKVRIFPLTRNAYRMQSIEKAKQILNDMEVEQIIRIPVPSRDTGLTLMRHMKLTSEELNIGFFRMERVFINDKHFVYIERKEKIKNEQDGQK